MPKPLIALVVCCAIIFNAKGQETTIPLPATVSGSDRQYSGLTLYRGNLLLLSQYPSSILYGIDTGSIKAVIKGSTSEQKLRSWKLVNFYPVIGKIRGYQGFEAMSCVKDTAYFLVETTDDEPSCWLLKATFTDTTLVFLDKTVELPKLMRVENGKQVKIKNAGYESLVYLQNSNLLLALFEYNKYPRASKGIMISPTMKIDHVVEVDPLDFRLTDVAESDGKIYGLNFHWTGSFDDYKPDERIEKGAGKIADWKADSYSRIVELKIVRDQVRFSPLRDISFKSDNWEGLVFFNNGFLVINDEFSDPSRKSGSHLVYIPIK